MEEFEVMPEKPFTDENIDVALPKAMIYERQSQTTTTAIGRSGGTSDVNVNTNNYTTPHNESEDDVSIT